MWTKLHQKIFEDLILDLNSIKLNYFVLRNYEMLPEINISKDVDIIIDPGKIKQVENIFIEVLKRNKISLFISILYKDTDLKDLKFLVLKNYIKTLFSIKILGY